MSPIIFALDYPSLVLARAGAASVVGEVGMIKVGLELFVEAGPAAVSLGQDLKLPVFLDLKLHDIPETVDRAVSRAAALGARLLTVHASGGPVMLRRAVERAAEASSGKLQIVAVTVLTSLDRSDLESIGLAVDPSAHAAALAAMAYENGVRNFVCSPADVRGLRQRLGADAVLITPGIRPAAAAVKGAGDDQKRVGTPAQAVADGANWIVVGRPIRDAEDPRQAARAINEEAMRSGRPSAAQRS